MAQGTGTVRATDTDLWVIVDGDEQPLVRFSHSQFDFDPGALVRYIDTDDNGVANEVHSAFDTALAASAVGRKRWSARFMSGSLAGALRVTPPQPSPSRDVRGLEAAKPETPKAAAPGYVTAVALLFPVEAATLFPVGQAAAGDNPIGLLIVVFVTMLFVIVLRYFATQDVDGDGEPDGKPAWNEIWAAVFSVFLWMGATKGYWVKGPGIIPNLGLTATQGANIYGFVTIIWVGLAPYIVKEKAKRDAVKAERDALKAPPK